ncbi:cupin domain-containing protein [Nocardia sp. NPDC050406]|uniref:cupin domain-containing protein n=1 Tax=Nocardia sp. NPDC050406 TaxID=3364318 RepID=UPI0037BA941A
MRVLFGVAVVSAACALGVGVPAQAAPSGVTGRVISQITVGGTDYVLRELTIAPGGSTGWHTHDGAIYGVVRSGTLTRHDAQCRLMASGGVGSGFVEPAGDVHITRNLSSEPLVMVGLQIQPTGSPAQRGVDDPGCALG